MSRIRRFPVIASFAAHLVEGDAVRARHAMSYHLVAIMSRLRENPAWTA